MGDQIVLRDLVNSIVLHISRCIETPCSRYVHRVSCVSCSMLIYMRVDSGLICFYCNFVAAVMTRNLALYTGPGPGFMHFHCAGKASQEGISSRYVSKLLYLYRDGREN